MAERPPRCTCHGRRRGAVRGPERWHRRAGAAAAAVRFESRGALHVEHDQARACVSGGRRDTAAGKVMRLSGSNVSHAGRFARRPLGTGASSTPLRRRRCLSVAAGVGWGGARPKVGRTGGANRRASARKAWASSSADTLTYCGVPSRIFPLPCSRTSVTVMMNP